jgi:ankyrin repeat protein
VLEFFRVNFGRCCDVELTWGKCECGCRSQQPHHIRIFHDVLPALKDWDEDLYNAVAQGRSQVRVAAILRHAGYDVREKAVPESARVRHGMGQVSPGALFGYVRKQPAPTIVPAAVGAATSGSMAVAADGVSGVPPPMPTLDHAQPPAVQLLPLSASPSQSAVGAASEALSEVSNDDLGELPDTDEVDNYYRDHPSRAASPTASQVEASASGFLREEPSEADVAQPASEMSVEDAAPARSDTDAAPHGKRSASDPPEEDRAVAPGDAVAERALEQARKVALEKQREATEFEGRLEGAERSLEQLSLQHEALKLSAGSDRPLCNAVELDEKGTFTTLLEAGRSADERDDEGRTPLILAAKHGRVEMARTLLEAGATADARETRGHTAFQYAFDMEARDAAIVARAKAAGAEAVGAVRAQARAEEMQNCMEMIRLLVDANADIHVATRDQVVGHLHGRTPVRKWPLSCAVEHGNVAVVQLLLERRANVNVRSNGCELYAPVHCPNGLMWEDDLMIAVKRNHAAMVELLVRHDICVNRPLIDSGDTALHFAVRFADGRVIATLLEVCADVDARNAQGETPLHDAASFWRSDVVAALLEGGADPNIIREEDTAVSEYVTMQADELSTYEDDENGFLAMRLRPLVALRAETAARVECRVTGALQKLKQAVGMEERFGGEHFIAEECTFYKYLETTGQLGKKTPNALLLLLPGTVVRIFGLQAKPQYNGAFGEMVKPVVGHAGEQRYAVRVPGVEKVLMLKLTNLEGVRGQNEMNQDGMGMKVRYNAVQVREKFRATDGRQCRMKLLDYRTVLASEVLPSGTCIFPTMGAVVIPIEPEGSDISAEAAAAGQDYLVTGQVRRVPLSNPRPMRKHLLWSLRVFCVHRR